MIARDRGQLDLRSILYIPAYEQPAWMERLVADGTLPPVEVRLPDEPQVFLASGMPDGLGEYGEV